MPELRREDVELLLSTYAWSLDTTVPEAVAATFASDAVLQTPTGTYHGTAEIAAFAEGSSLADRGWQHWTGNIQFQQLSEDSGSVRSYVAVLDTHAEPPQIVAAGVYLDELGYIDGRWAFRSRRWAAMPPAQ
ncbi:nuclear transport factor 2 family protein [Microbacterium sp. NPDC089696]|uniref:nuclear transport factor 2 family protein n=1 Tax=Microbacterium sp. NPDC089696 TaxID=3364199 RepID=UPI0037FBEE52